MDRTRLSRVLAEGDALVFDNGRIVVRHEVRNGRSARVVIEMDANVVLASPPKKTTLVLPAARITHTRKR